MNDYVVSTDDRHMVTCRIDGLASGPPEHGINAVEAPTRSCAQLLYFVTSTAAAAPSQLAEHIGRVLG